MLSSTRIKAKSSLRRGCDFPTGSWGGGVGEDDYSPGLATAIYPGVVKKVSILGHSFVKEIYVDKPIYHPFCIVRTFSQPGAKVNNIRESVAWQHHVEYKPDLTFLLIGGNDICHDTDIRTLAHGIEDLAREIEARSGKVIIIGLEKRTHPRNLSIERYTSIRNGVNRWLKRVLPWARDRHLAIQTSEEDLGPDGVHLKPAASERLFLRIMERAGEVFRGDADALKQVQGQE